jgi:hypothetical protein
MTAEMHGIYDRLLDSARLATISDLVPYIEIPTRISISEPSSRYLHLIVIHSQQLIANPGQYQLSSAILTADLSRTLLPDSSKLSRL